MARIKVLGGQNTPEYQADDHTVEIDAAAVARAVTEVVAKHHRESIKAGEKPSGGSQKALSEGQRKRAAKGKRLPQRGMGVSGRFAAGVADKKARGIYRATGTVAVDGFFDEWLEREKKRGVEYLDVEGQVDAIVEEAVERVLKEQGFG